MQAYAGTAAPFNFNGLVRHYYMRQSPELGDLQINLADKVGARPQQPRHRARPAPAAAALHCRRAARCRWWRCRPARRCWRRCWPRSTARTRTTRRAVAEQVKALFRSVPFIVDVDRFLRPSAAAAAHRIDQDELEYFGVEQSDVYDTMQALFGGVPVGYSHRGEERDPIEIRIGLPKSDLSWDERLAATPVPANTLPGSKTVVELGQVVRAEQELGSPVLFRRDGHFADMVMGELAGAFEAPIYGMLAVDKAVAAHDWGKLPKPAISLRGQPDGRIASDAAVGRRVGDHLRHVPRHGRGVRRGDAGHLHPGGGAVPQLQAAAGDPDADSADADRHRARALAVRRAVHRHVDDRLHRAGRDHRAQLDPAGGFRAPWRPGRADVARGAAGRRARSASSRSC